MVRRDEAPCLQDEVRRRVLRDDDMTVLVTGAAGFIGRFVCLALLARGQRVLGVDNLNDYYTPQLKEDRLKELEGKDGFTFQKLDIADFEAVKAAAQAAGGSCRSTCRSAASAARPRTTSPAACASCTTSTAC